jgi:wyosine [tRNA(Phe)-imidazoG37] synthetase (radical SAM superfamily)
LELFIVPGINDSDDSIARFAQIIQNMRLDKIQLNALDRCGTEDDVPVSSSENAARFAAVLGKFAEVEFVGRNNARTTDQGTTV